MKRILATALILATFSAPTAAVAKGQRKPAPLFVLVVSHFDRPWVMTQEDLRVFEQLSENHPQVRWTHLYNPAAYTQPTPLREEMERFVQRSRDEHGAEIGVHLHMYESFLKAAGVAFRMHPSVNARTAADSRDETGYSVPMSSYSPAEMDAMLEFTLETFKARGLGRPATFCAGYFTTSIDLQQQIALRGFATSAAAFPPGTEIGLAYPPSWRELAGWDESVRIDTGPYRVSQKTILPAGEPPFIEAHDGAPLVEVPQTCKIDWMVSSDDMKVIFQKHLAIAQSGQPTAVCLAIHEMDAQENGAKYDEVLRYIDEHISNSDHEVPIRYATASQARAAFLEHWKK